MTTDAPPKSRHVNYIALAACSLLIVVYAVLSYSAVITKSATYDEPMHALGAWAHLHLGDFRINFEDAPLWHYWASIPNGRNSINVNLNDPSWTAMPENVYQEWPFTTRTLYQTPGNDGAAFVNRSRFMMMLVGVGLAVLMAAWAWRLGGAIAAVIVAALFCFDPNFLGHGPLVKNDVAMALLMAATFMLCWHVGQRLTWLNASMLALVVAAAVNTKFSALLFGPMLVIALIIRAWLPIPWPVLKRTLKTFRSKITAAVVLCLGIAFVSYIAIWACYGFRFAPSPDETVQLNTWRHKYEAANYKFQSIYPPPQPIVRDPTIPLDKLAQQLGQALDSVNETVQEMNLAMRESQEISPMLRSILTQRVAQWAQDHANTLEMKNEAERFFRNLPPREIWAAGVEDRLRQLSDIVHTRKEQLRLLKYDLQGWVYFARVGDIAPDGFIRLLNFFLDNRLLPSAWVHGVLFVHARSIIRGSYLLGSVSPTGWWYYFPLAMLFKTPIATLIGLLGAMSVGLWIAMERKAEWKRFAWPLACLLVPFAVYMYSVITANLNIGLRHVLPAYPFMYVAAAVLIAWLIRSVGKAAVVAVAGLGVMLIIEATAVWPNYIAYFNFAFAEHKLDLLADSNLDWGQDLPLLAEWQAAHPDMPLAFGPIFTDPGGGSYFGTVDPNFYRVGQVTFPTSDPNNPQRNPLAEIPRTHVVAISATLLQGVYGGAYSQFREHEPIAVLGDTIYIYDLRTPKP